MSSFQKMADTLKRRVSLMVGRAALAMVNDGSARQYVQFTALKGEVKDTVERTQQYGFTGHPLAGAQVVFICMGGNRDHPIAISVDDPRFRLTGLAPGEVAIYNHEGTKIVLKNGGEILMTAATKIRVETPRLECTGDIIDRCDTNGNTIHEMRDIFDGHTHPENDSGGPTDDPNQKMQGS